MAAEWSDEHTQIVCELFAEQVERGNRPNTHLNIVGFSEVAKRFQERTGLDYKKLQFKNKWDKLKNEFTIWNKLRRRETGCGWDEVKKTIKMDDDWWKKAKEDIPGAMHDTSVLYHALRVDRDVFPHPPQGKYYVVDAGYPNRPGYLAPFKGERYHIPEFHRGMEPATPKERFNRVHSSVRNVVERAFGVWKMRWPILFKMPNYPLPKQKMIVAATMAIHNFIREHATDDLHFHRCDRDPNYVPTIPSRYHKYAISQGASDGATQYSNERSMDTFRDEMATEISLAW